MPKGRIAPATHPDRAWDSNRQIDLHWQAIDRDTLWQAIDQVIVRALVDRVPSLGQRENHNCIVFEKKIT